MKMESNLTNDISGSGESSIGPPGLGGGRVFRGLRASRLPPAIIFSPSRGLRRFNGTELRETRP